MSDQSRLIVDPDIPLDLLEAAAERAGWVKVADEPRDGNRPRSVIWEGPWPGLKVYYVDDHLIGVPYLLIHGPNSEQALEDVMETLPSHAIELAIMDALAARESEDKKTSIRRLAVLGAAAEPDPHTLSIFDGAFTDPDPEVRKVAVGATTYPAWREFEPRLQIVADGDSDEGVRELAGRTLSALRRHNWS
jgi:hypothetical protein